MNEAREESIREEVSEEQKGRTVRRAEAIRGEAEARRVESELPGGKSNKSGDRYARRGNVEGGERPGRGDHELSPEGERAAHENTADDRKGGDVAGAESSVQAIAPLVEEGVSERLVLADKRNSVVEAKSVGSELASEKGGHSGWEDVVEALLGGDVLFVDPEDGAQFGVGVATITSAVEGLQLTLAAWDGCRDAVGTEGGKRAGGAGAHAAFELMPNAAEAGVDDERRAEREGDAVGVVGAKAEL